MTRLERRSTSAKAERNRRRRQRRYGDWKRQSNQSAEWLLTVKLATEQRLILQRALSPGDETKHGRVWLLEPFSRVRLFSAATLRELRNWMQQTPGRRLRRLAEAEAKQGADA